MAESVVIGLSDGVDSAVAAYILKNRGYDVTGIYLDIGGEAEREDAKASARLLQVPLHIVDVKERLEKYVCKPFIEAYLSGRTPNPCIGCNPKVKFAVLAEEADQIGAHYIATGHYAICDFRYIYMGISENDQSYMLNRLQPAQVSRLILPLGSMQKDEIRRTAQKIGLSVAQKPDSRENCFIKGMTYDRWISERCDVPGPGKVYYRGEVFAEHSGIYCYTVGQRWPEMHEGRRLYVQQIDAKQNSLTLALWEDLFCSEIRVRQISWINESFTDPFRGRVRVRHTKWETPECTFYPEGEYIRIVTDTPLRAPAPGQAAAFYIGTKLVGGGYIIEQNED